MKEFWNSRYQDDKYAYGTQANIFFKQTLHNLNLKGTLLLPLEGEGRNAVFAAQFGLEVTAFDYSEVAQNKALALASKNGVSFSYLIGDINSVEFDDASFDAIALIFAHFPPQLRSDYHRKLSKYLKPGGIIILEGFSKNHLLVSKDNLRTSGPQNIELLFTKDNILSDFEGFETLLVSEEIVELNEGDYHQGKSSVIQYIGKKPLI